MLRDYLLFEKFLTPAAMQFLFWAGIVGTLYGSWWLYAHDNWAWVMSLIFGPLMTRLIIESFILRFRTYACLREISGKLDARR